MFILLGISAGVLGALFGRASFQLYGAVYGMRYVVAKIGGLAVVAFGLRTMGVLTMPVLHYDTRRQAEIKPGIGIASLEFEHG